MRILACIALATLLLAGCSGPSSDGTTTGPAAPAEPQDPWPAVQELMAGVPCEAEVPANGNSDNLRILSQVAIPLEQEGRHAELDIRGDLAIHARYSAGGFELYGIADPLRPVHLGNFSDADGGLDVKFGPDNRTVFVGTGGGIVIVDVADPQSPVRTGELVWSDLPAAPAGPARGAFLNAHMLYTKRIAEKDWLFLAPNTGTGVWVFEIGGEPGNRTLTYAAQTLPAEGGPLGPHDMYVQKDALDGHWYLYSADGLHGWTAFNVDDPANPVPAGGWTNPAELSYTHTIQAAAVGGKRIVATIGEVGGNLLRVYDATVLAAPVLLAVWQAPEQVASPQHNFNIAGDSLYLSYYSHGLYVFNLTDALTAGLGVPLVGSLGLAPRAHWDVAGETAGPLSFTGFWDTLVKDGVIYVSHIEGGLIVFGYGCNAVPDARLTSDG